MAIALHFHVPTYPLSPTHNRAQCLRPWTAILASTLRCPARSMFAVTELVEFYGRQHSVAEVLHRMRCSDGCGDALLQLGWCQGRHLTLRFVRDGSLASGSKRRSSVTRARRC
jgi:hypothetical protein